MLTVAKMGGGKADYYLTLAAEDYYVGRKSALEPEGYWLGAGADWKGLKGVVEATAFMHLFAGYAPDGKQRLVANAGQRGRMPGYDLTMAAPKSVSICWALSVGATRKGIEAAHQAAIAATVRKMEEAMKIRTGSGGKTTERAGLIAAVFQHATARQVDEHTPPDMHLHSHICVMNVGVTAQGKEGALDGRALLNAEFAKEYGAYYRAELAKGLYEMGFELVQTGGGFAIKGVKEELVAEFSKRARQIEEQLAKERQEASAKEKLKANHATREPKSRPDPKDIENHWHYTAKEKHHFTWETVERLRSKEQAVKRKSTPQERQAVVRAAAHELAEEKGAFSKRELRERALGAAGIKGLGASGMREAVDQYVKYEATYLAARTLDFQGQKGEQGKSYKEALYTTRQHQYAALKHAEVERAKEERKVLAWSEAGRRLERQGYRIMAATWSRNKAEWIETRAGIKTVTVRQLIADAQKEEQLQARASRELERQQRKNELVAEWKYATWQWSRQTRNRMVQKPESTLAHEIKYATHQISKKQRDYLNRQLKEQQQAKARQERQLTSNTVLMIDAPSRAVAGSEELRELVRIADKYEAKLMFREGIYQTHTAGQVRREHQGAEQKAGR